MLQQTTFKANDVITVKLVSGEEVIGYFVESNADGVTLRKPLVPVDAGQGQMALAPFLMTGNYMRAGTNLTFNRVAVVTQDHTVEQIADAYAQQVSGLAQAPKKPGLIT